MRLAYVLSSKIGRSETFIYDTLHSFSKIRDLDITVISGENERYLDLDGIIEVPCGFKFRNYKAERIKYLFFKILGIDANKKLYNRRLRAVNKKILRSLKSKFDLIYIDYADVAIDVLEFILNSSVPTIVHVHGYDITSRTKDPNYLLLLRKLFSNNIQFVAASEYMRRRLILLGCSPINIHVISLGVDLNNIQPLPWSERIKLPKTISFLGRLTEKKNPIALLYAFKIVLQEYPDVNLNIIGDGPLKNVVIDTIEKLNIGSNVVMHGSLSREESFPILNKSWMYAQHSVTSVNGDTEGFAISLSEALLHGIPVVSTIHNGITENVIDGKSGYLVPEYDYEAMADKIIYLLRNPELAEKLGAFGQSFIKEKCNPAKRISILMDLFNELTSK